MPSRAQHAIYWDKLERLPAPPVPPPLATSSTTRLQPIPEERLRPPSSPPSAPPPSPSKHRPNDIGEAGFFVFFGALVLVLLIWIRWDQSSRAPTTGRAPVGDTELASM